MLVHGFSDNMKVSLNAVLVSYECQHYRAEYYFFSYSPKFSEKYEIFWFSSSGAHSVTQYGAHSVTGRICPIRSNLLDLCMPLSRSLRGAAEPRVGTIAAPKCVLSYLILTICGGWEKKIMIMICKITSMLVVHCRDYFIMLTEYDRTLLSSPIRTFKNSISSE